MNLGHEFEFVYIPMVNKLPHRTNLKSCKYCNYLLFSSTNIYNIPNCISEEEKIIKDLLE